MLRNLSKGADVSSYPKQAWAYSEFVMVGKPHIPMPLRGKIVALWEEGYPTRQCKKSKEVTKCCTEADS
jgi:hypothetical protein